MTILKKYFISFFAILLVIGLSGCSNSKSTSSSSSSVSKKGKVTITLAWWGDTERNKKYNAIADEFEKEHPNIIVKRQVSAWNDYWDKLATQTAGGNAPDVVGMHQMYVSDYARRNTLVDLGPYIKDGTIDLSNFPKSVADSGQVAGKTYMVAQGITMTGENVNNSLLDKIGVTPPDDTWTWDNLVSKATQIQQAINSKGLQKTWAIDDESGEYQATFEYYLRSHGKDLYTADGKLDYTEKDVADWFNMWQKLRKAGAIPDAATSQEYVNASLEQSMFVKGMLVMHALPANQLYLYQDQMKNTNLSMVPFPQGPNGPGEYIEGAYLSVTKSSKHPKEAAEFINFFVNSEKALKIFQVEQGAPGSSKMDAYVKPMLNPAQQKGMEFIQKTLELAKKAPYPPTGNQEITTDFSNAAQSVAFGKASVDQAAADFYQKAQSVAGQ